MSDDFAARLKKGIQSERESIQAEQNKEAEAAAHAKDKQKADTEAARRIDEQIIDPALRVFKAGWDPPGPSLTAESNDLKREFCCGFIVPRGRVNVTVTRDSAGSGLALAIGVSAHRGALTASRGGGESIYRATERFDASDVSGCRAWLESKLVDAAIAVTRFIDG